MATLVNIMFILTIPFSHHLSAILLLPLLPDPLVGLEKEDSETDYFLILYHHQYSQFDLQGQNRANFVGSLQTLVT